MSPNLLDEKKKFCSGLLKKTSSNRFIDLEDELMVTRVEGSGGGIVRDLEINMYALLCLKCITNKDLLYSTGNSAQYYVTT